MKIERIDLWHVAIPLPGCFRPAWIPGYVQTENRFTLIRLRTSSGLEGWSAAPALGREREGLGELLGPYLLGERADDLPSIQQRLREISYLGWRCGWIEAACWDLIGKAAGKPVYELLGGPRGAGQVRLYASTGETRTPEGRARELDARIIEGFDAVKLRVHASTLAQDIEHIEAARAHVGDAIDLAVDANQGWRVAAIADAPCWDLARATAFCRAAAALGYAWVEEPLAKDARRQLVRLRDAVDVAIAGGELCDQGLPELTTLIELGCLDIYQPDAVMTGGIAETFEIVRRVRAAGCRYSPHTWTNGIGFAINLQLFVASGEHVRERLEYPLAPPGWTVGARDGLLEQPWTHTRGWLPIPTAPGLGFTIDPWALRRHASRFFVASPLRVAVSAVLDKGLWTARSLGQARARRLGRRSRALDRALDEQTPAQLGLEAAASRGPALDLPSAWTPILHEGGRLDEVGT